LFLFEEVDYETAHLAIFYSATERLMKRRCRRDYLTIRHMDGDQTGYQHPNNSSQACEGQHGQLEQIEGPRPELIPPESVLFLQRLFQGKFPEKSEIRSALLAGVPASLLVPAFRAAMNQNVVTHSTKVRVFGIRSRTFWALHAFLPAPNRTALRSSLLSTADKELPKERQPGGERRKKNAFKQHGALPHALVAGIRSRLFSGNQDSQVFQEIYTAFFTTAPVALLMMAGGTLVSQRCMAAGAEPRRFRRVISALRAFHNLILAGREKTSSGGQRQCAHFVTAS
jgi:hypothetical protein